MRFLLAHVVGPQLSPNHDVDREKSQRERERETDTRKAGRCLAILRVAHSNNLIASFQELRHLYATDMGVITHLLVLRWWV